MELLGGLYGQTENQFNNRTEVRLIILHQERGRKPRVGRWREATETKANSDNHAYFGVVELIPTSPSQSQQVTLLRNPPRTHSHSNFLTNFFGPWTRVGRWKNVTSWQKRGLFWWIFHPFCVINTKWWSIMHNGACVWAGMSLMM